METKILRIPPDRSEEYTDELKEAAEIIKRGGLVAFPTETVYGLGANALDEKAAEKIYSAKGRPSDNPLIIHIADKSDYKRYCEVEDEEALGRLTDAFVPGPITIIQKKKNIIPDTVTAGMDSVAVRFPSHPIARRLIELAGVPIAAPSANTSGRPSPTKAEHVIEDMMGKVDMIIDGGESDVGLESTIVLIKEGALTLLRPGGITPRDLEAVWGEIKIDKAVSEKLGDGEKPLAPGMKYRHYAPTAQVVLLKGENEKVVAFIENALKNNEFGAICYREDGFSESERVRIVGSANDKNEMAHRLFDTLRYFDKNENIKVIYARLPDSDDIGLALVNRLKKASGYTVLEV
ncbi:MAG: threonylcarbamoyl-AMP synthase [Clostridia bacterium]|nr:threonylcarbamoyl-AMP synthase [Clostridia bacterium]